MIKKITLLCIVLIPVLLIAQNVGIGTVSPVMKLHVVNPDSAVALFENTETLGPGISNALYFKTGNGLTQYTGAVKTIGESSGAARLGFFTYAAFNANSLKERMSITDGGKVGIGITTPQSNLHINPAGAGSLLIGTDKANGGYTNIEMGISAQSNGYGYLQATKTSGSTYGVLSLNPNGGNVGIGTATPATSLDVRGGIALPVKVITGSYIVQANDYTIVADLQNSLAANIEITLPGQYTSTGRIIKIVAINIPARGGNMSGGSSPFGKVEIYSGTTLVSTLTYLSLSDYHNNGNGQDVHTELYDGVFATTLQCTGTSLGWIETDRIAHYNYFVDVHDD